MRIGFVDFAAMGGAAVRACLSAGRSEYDSFPAFRFLEGSGDSAP